MPGDNQDWVRKVVIPVSFRSLTDTPGSFDGAVKKTIVVNDTETALVYSDLNLDDHSARHEEGAVDEVTGITGKLNNHSARHENGGADEISVAGLSGVLAEWQKPQDHGSRHEAGGGDEVQIADLSDYKETTVELGGDFDAGEKVKILKIGNWVWIFGDGRLSHTENNYAISSSGVIPSQYRPLYQTQNPYYTGVGGHAVAEVLTGGTFTTEYYGFDGSLPNKPNTVDPPKVSYPVA